MDWFLYDTGLGHERIKGSYGILAVSHNPDKFGDNMYCDKWDLMFLICHVTLINTCLNGHVRL